MSTENMDTKVEQVDINIDELFDGTASADSVMVNQEPETTNIFSKKPDTDFSFAEPNQEESNEDEVKDETKEETKETPKESAEEVFDSLNEEEDEEKVETRGRKKISGIADVFGKLIKDEKIIPFDDDKPLEEYSAKDWEELIEANFEDKIQKARQETPKQFFESLPQELQLAAKYVADGGTDLRGLFATLAQSEEAKTLNIKDERDQEVIIRDYLQATGYGTREEIDEEIELWRDLGKLEQQAAKFKPKLDKMQDQIVASKLQEQEMRRKQQEQASQQYMQNVYETLKDGKINDLKLDRKTQSMLYSGLVEPNYPSVSGKNTNLLGHLLEKYQFVEPNYALLSEALWLLSDPDGYKSKIMEKGSQKAVESTVRKLKTEQASAASSSLGVEKHEESNRPKRKKLTRPNNIFKRF